VRGLGYLFMGLLFMKAFGFSGMGNFNLRCQKFEAFSIMLFALGDGFMVR
jgi:hypothetical protein